MRAARILAPALALAALATGSLAGGASAAPGGASGAGLGLERVGGAFASPVYVTAPPLDARRLMVVEQGGTVRVVRDGATLSQPFLQLSGDFASGGERGLLSIAFPPDYASSGYVYAYYTDASGSIAVDQFRRDPASPDRVESGYRRRVITIPHPEAGNHNGGTVRFGPDGYMYLGTGDGGNGYDFPTRDARDTTSLLGKILRIAPRAGGGYTVPAGNPFGNAVWSYGLRNPYRFSFDLLSGDLTIADVGQATIEEVDFARAASGLGRGANFGWDDCEGSIDVSANAPGEACTLPNDVLPVLQYGHDAQHSSITGGVVVRDPGLEQLYGRYLFGDLSAPTMRSAVLSTPVASGDRAEGALAVSGLVGVGEDACGRVYAVEYGGRVSRVRDSTPSGCPPQAPAPPGMGATQPAPAPPGPGAFAPVSAASLALRLGGPLRQRLRSRYVKVRVRCSQACRVEAFGRLSVRRRGRSLGLRQHRAGGVAAQHTVTLWLAIPRSSRTRVRGVLSRHRRVQARVIVVARGADGRLVRLSRLVRILR